MKKAEATRLMILQKAFELIYAKGYQATSVDEILATTQVTKGAFYYHFKTKDEMGLAMVKEILQPTLINSTLHAFLKEQHPLDAIYNLMDELLLKDGFLKMEYGCPASNLIQEMASWHPSFNNALNTLMEQWVELITVSIEQGQKKELVKKAVNAKQVALYIMSSYWGIRNFGKLKSTTKVYESYLKELRGYLKGMK